MKNQVPFWPVKIADNVTVCVQPTVNQMSSYILLEQEDWFEDVRQYDAGLVYFKTNVQALLLKTIALLASMPGKSNKTFPYMSVLDFASSLRRYFLEENTRLNFAEFQRHGRLSAAQNHRIEQVLNALKRRAPAVNFEILNGFPAHKGCKPTGQPENMVEMAVGDQDAVESFKTDPGLEYLTLRAFAAVNQKTEFIMFDHQRR